MYRRSIVHILGPLAFLLALFVGYHAWFKPTFRPSPPPPPPKTEAAEAPAPRPTEPAPETAPHAESPRVRLIDPGDIPDSEFAETLKTVYEELEKANYAEAEAKLAALSPKALAQPQLRRYAAVLWNNLGVQQEKTGGTEASVKAFKTAVSLDPANPVAHLNLAHAYWELRDPALTPEFLETVIRLAPAEPFPRLAMADLLQERDDLGAAARHLEQAADRAGQDPALLSYLQTVAAKVKRTEKTEQQMTARGSTHFTVKFDGQEDQTTWIGVLEILEEAYRDIGQKFGYFPARPIIVVLHTKDNFLSATGSPMWADGLFDPVLGRIQIPTQGAMTDQVWLTRVLRHEFVHALLHERMGLEAASLPTWLNEGLAMQLAGDPWPDLDQIIQGEVKLLPLTALEGSWVGLSTEAAAVAYFEANSAVRYLIDRFGMHRIGEMLAMLKARHTLAAAMQDKLFLSYDQFQRQWAEQLHAKPKTGRT